MKPISLSVIIPTCDRPDTLKRCLQLLSQQEQQRSYTCAQSDREQALEYEIIVSDDSRGNLAKDILKNEFPEVIWSQGKRKGPASNRNNGASFAKGDWLVFTDDDCIPANNLLVSYAHEISKDPSLIALEGSIYPEGNIDQDLAECPVNYNGGNFWSANIAIKKDAFQELGGFDISYPYAAHEDQDIKIQLDKITKIRFVKDAIVKHPVRILGLWKTIRKMPVISKSWGYHLAKNGEHLDIFNTFEVYKQSLFFNLYSMLGQAKQGYWKQSLIKFSYMTIGSILAARSYKNYKSKISHS